MLKSLVLSSLLWLTAACLAGTDSRAISQQTFPIQAELISPLQSGRTQVGDAVMVKLTTGWSFGLCKLARGSVLTGRVTAVEAWSRSSKRSSISLLFNEPCPEEPAEALAWIALLAPDDGGLAGLAHAGPVALQAFRSSSFGEGAGLGASGIENHVDMSGRQNPGLPLFTDAKADLAIPRPSAVATGQVWHLPGLTLGVATGPAGSSTLSSKLRSIELARGAVLVLQPFSAAVEHPVNDSRALPKIVHTHLAAVHDDVDACKPPTCTMASAAGWNPSASSSPAQIISLKEMGYNRLKSSELLDFEYGAALAYLGSDQLLFTFNSHALITRTPEDDPASHPRMARAVLIDLKLGGVAKVVDWRIGDGRQYLWPLPGDRVLVHRGRSLVLLGRDLEELAILHLAGPLAFVAHSPDGKHLAVGMVHELHTPKVHQELAKVYSRGPEEEVYVQLLDERFQTLSESRQSSQAMPLVLSDQGRIALLHAGGEHWRYELTGWGGEVRTVARLGSSCIPKMSSLTAGLLFVQGCDAKSDVRWYRVLRLDGRSVLKGALLSQDIDPLPLGGDSGDGFALSMPEAHAGYLPGLPFHGADLTSEAVRVYAAEDGHRCFVAQTHLPAPTKQPVAFAPGGGHIAVLDGDQIAIYALGDDVSKGVDTGELTSVRR